MADRLALHDVEDAAAFVAAIASASGLALSRDDREDLEQYLLAECWKLSERYEPSGFPFSNWAWRTLKLRVVDWQRQRFGRRTWRFHDRVHERPRIHLQPLDGDGDQLAELEPASSGDRPQGGAADFDGLLGDRGQSFARDLETMGLRQSRRATG